MNYFKDKFKQHIQKEELQAKEKELQAKRNADAAIQAEKEKLAFENNFTFEVARVARPIFEEFVEAAKESGFPAEFNSGTDGKGHQFIDVRFVAIQGATLNANKSDESVFVLRCKNSTLKVAHVMYYDQRPGKNGKNEFEYGLPSINENVIRRELDEFLTLSLKSRSQT